MERFSLPNIRFNVHHLHFLISKLDLLLQLLVHHGKFMGLVALLLKEPQYLGKKTRTKTQNAAN